MPTYLFRFKASLLNLTDLQPTGGWGSFNIKWEVRMKCGYCDRVDDNFMCVRNYRPRYHECTDPNCVGSDLNSGQIDLVTGVGQPLTIGTGGFLTGARIESAHNIIHECRISTLWSARAVNDGGPFYDDIYLQDGSVFIKDEEVNEILIRYEVRNFDCRLDPELYNEGDDDDNDDDGGDESGGGEEEGGDGDDNGSDEGGGGEEEGGDGDIEGDHEDDDDSDDYSSDGGNGYGGGCDENGVADNGYVSDPYEANGF